MSQVKQVSLRYRSEGLSSVVLGSEFQRKGTKSREGHHVGLWVSKKKAQQSRPDYIERQTASIIRYLT